MNARENPCNGCQSRTADCHSVCIRYGFWKYIHQAAKDKERKERQADDIMAESAVARKARWQKRLHKKRT